MPRWSSAHPPPQSRVRMPSLNESVWPTGTDRGFLPSANPLQHIGVESWECVEALVALLPELVGSDDASAVATAVAGLPDVDVNDLSNHHELERAFLCLCLISHAYLRFAKEDNEGVRTLPAKLAVPWKQVADRVNRPPIIDYAACVLYNWRLEDPSKGFDLDNIRILNTITGTVDEEWFFRIHVAIEAAAARAMANILIAQEALHWQDNSLLHKCLAIIIDSLDEMNEILPRMLERCDVEVFYDVIRKFLGGYSPGVVFLGVNEYFEMPQKFVGASGAQSTVVPVLDSFFGVAQSDATLAAITVGMRAYMPETHRMFLTQVEAKSRLSLRTYLLSQPSFLDIVQELKEQHDIALEGVANFRKGHLQFAQEYIVKQAKRNAQAVGVGTGGSPFMKYLAAHLKDTRAVQFKNGGEFVPPRVPAPLFVEYCTQSDWVPAFENSPFMNVSGKNTPASAASPIAGGRNALSGFPDSIALRAAVEGIASTGGGGEGESDGEGGDGGGDTDGDVAAQLAEMNDKLTKIMEGQDIGPAPPAITEKTLLYNLIIVTVMVMGMLYASGLANELDAAVREAMSVSFGVPMGAGAGVGAFPMLGLTAACTLVFAVGLPVSYIIAAYRGHL